MAKKSYSKKAKRIKLKFRSLIKISFYLVKLIIRRLFSSANRRNKKILFCMEKWADCNPECGETNSMHNIIGSFKNAGLAEFETFFYDEYSLNEKESSSIGLIKKIAETDCDCVFITIVPGLEKHPSSLLIWFLSKILRIKIVFCWFDFVVGMVRKLAMKHRKTGNLSIVLDAPYFVSSNKKFSKKFLPLWTPQDCSIFKDDNLERDIDVSFLGSLNNYPDRIAALDFLKKKGIKVYHDGGQRENRLSVEEYVNILKRSKIVINFSFKDSHHEIHQSKGRVFEASLCGAMVLEQNNKETKYWFSKEDGIVFFDNLEDLAQKIEFYLKNQKQLEEARKILHQKSLTNYDDKNFWRTVINKVF